MCAILGDVPSTYAKSPKLWNAWKDRLFADLYAAYHTGILKDTHPMVKNFLLDM